MYEGMRSSVYGDVFKALDKTSNCIVAIERIIEPVNEGFLVQQRKWMELQCCNAYLLLRMAVLTSDVQICQAFSAYSFPEPLGSRMM